MASALASGMVSQGFRKDQIRGTDPAQGAREAFHESTGAGVESDVCELVAWAEVLILAVKPHQVADVLRDIAPQWRKEQLLISIAAGIQLHQMEVHLPEGARVIRVMPNTPAMVGASASAFASNTCASEEDQQTACALLSVVGVAEAVPEKWLDAITGLSGCGPAYGYLMIEALSDGAVSVGLPRELATRFAAQTLLGAAKMVLETGKHPGELKDMVTSPGGATIEGVHALEMGGLRATLMNAVRAATAQSKKLAAGE